MNTPSHAILNLTMLGRRSRPEFNLAIALGGILPDIPIFIFFIWATWIEKMPRAEMWSVGYYQPFWQNAIATFHSIPLALIGVGIAYWRKWQTARLICLSMIFHDLLDLPVHNDDAHRHFFPFSNYRFISPISYWDSDHYGDIVAVVEMLLVLASTIYLFRWVRSPIGKMLMIGVNLFYLIGFIVMYLM